MKNHQEGKTMVNVLVFQYEAMSQNETVPFFEKSAFWQIAQHYLSTNQLDKASTALEHALTFHAHSPEFHIFAAEVSLRTQNIPAAVASLRAAQELIEEDNHATIYRLEAFIELGYFQRAIEELERFKVVCGEFSSKEQSINIPQYLRNYRRTEVMFDYLLDLLKAQPNNEHTLKHFYFHMEATGNYETAIPVLEEVLEQYPMLTTAWFNLGIAHQQTGDLNSAHDAFEFAIITDSNNLGAHIELAHTAFDLERYKTALQTWQYICRHFSVESEYLVKMGECYEMLGEHDIAFELFQRAISIDSNCSQAYYKLGNQCLRDRKLHQARSHFLSAQKLDPLDENFGLSLAATYIEIGDTKAALRELKKAYRNNPENVNCAIALIMLLLDCNLDKQAYQKCREAMIYHNAVPILTALRGVAVLRLGKKREGFTWIHTAVEEGLESTDIIYKFLDDADQILL